MRSVIRLVPLITIASSAFAQSVTQLFNFSTAVDIENSNIRPNGHLLLSTFANGGLYTLNPQEQHPQAEMVALLPGATALTGITAIGIDKFAISGGVRGHYHYDNETIYTVDFRRNATVQVVAKLPQAEMLNGLCALPTRPHVVLSADSRVGGLWRVDTSRKGGNVQLAFQHEALAAPANASSPLGVNGLKIVGGHVYFTNSARGILGRVPVNEDGTVFGEVSVIAHSGGPSWDDMLVDASGVANTESSSPCPDLYPASFNESVYDSIRPNNCINTTSANWYSCAKTNPPFLGCCKSNPCAQTAGCPTSDLVPAAWSKSSIDQLSLFLDGAPSSTTGPSEPTASPSDSDSALSAGAIAGIVIGATAAVIFAVVMIFLLRQRRRRSREDGGREPQCAHLHDPAPSYDQGPQQADPLLNASPGTLTSKHRASSSIGTAYGSPTVVWDGRPMSEVSSDDYHRWNQGLHIEGLPTSAAQAKSIPELDSTPNEVYEIGGR
ncbi:hypothetical protein BDV59DRAFT_197804 [Aspergillus ambiguus]|uniref:uncharacterized protein n=1 Tax=Aspergillus ambiguus TaxID=176160 RepID=UPI003CCD83D0